MIEQIVDGIWTTPAPLTFAGVNINTRMTVCRVSDGLALIAPIPRSEELGAAVDKLGPVKAIIAPNLMHHLYVGDWIDAYPDAVSFGPHGLAAKRQDLTLTHELGPAYDERFGDELSRFPIEGMPRLNESLFLHRESGTLIATDFCFYMPKASGLTALFTMLMGIHKKTRVEPLFRILIKNKAACLASLEPLRTIQIQHLSMCHHHVLSDGANAALEQVLDQLKVPTSH
jgi:hypothetical protein